MSSTKGALVNEHMETMIPGIFTCGNCLHVHDVVDFVTDEGRLAGHGAALYLQNLLLGVREINVYPNSGVSYVVPQKVNLDNQEDVTFKFRVQKPVKDVFVLFESNNVIISKVFKSALIPSEMIMIKLNRDKLANVTGDITVHLEGR